MTEHSTHYRSMFECVDENMESLPGSNADTNGALFYHVEVVFPVNLITITRNSTVWCVLNNSVTVCIELNYLLH